MREPKYDEHHVRFRAGKRHTFCRLCRSVDALICLICRWRRSTEHGNGMVRYDGWTKSRRSVRIMALCLSTPTLAIKQGTTALFASAGQSPAVGLHRKLA